MKIVIDVNYSSSKFNMDFKLSNMLIERGHNVFLAISQEQFLQLKKNCDKAVLGFSSDGIIENSFSLSMFQTIDSAIEFIEK
ncbi:MAG: hypothetical protein IJW59_05455 [Clostridia bacterium]|nr:hypothetical protein [Clostridia bacterium]